MDFPIWDFRAGGAAAIGAVAVLHSIFAHFAVGAGILLALAEPRAARLSDRVLLDLARRAGLVLVAVSTVAGALSGVGIWLLIMVVTPAATSMLVRTFLWIWAAEWCFFLVDIGAALLWRATLENGRERAHLLLARFLGISSVVTLLAVQAILAFMLTPGRWLETGSVWDAIGNPTWLPGFLLRLGASLLLAGAVWGIVAAWGGAVGAGAGAGADAGVGAGAGADAGAGAGAGVRAPGTRAVRFAARAQIAGVILAAAGYLWWDAVVPASARAFYSGPAPILPAIASARAAAVLAAGFALGVALVTALLPRIARGRGDGAAVGPGLVLPALALLAGCVLLGGYEFVREGARKPFLIRGELFSNGLRVEDIERINARGLLASAPWAARAAVIPGGAGVGAVVGAGGAGVGTAGNVGAEQIGAEDTGAAVFRAACSLCHTTTGALSIRKRLADPSRISGILAALREDGRAYAAARRTAGPGAVPGSLHYPMMPPLAGTDAEAAALAQYLGALAGSVR